VEVSPEHADSFGEDGTIFGLPDTRIQLEIVRARGAVTAPDQRRWPGQNRSPPSPFTATRTSSRTHHHRV
jgi:hypothetical protein